MKSALVFCCMAALMTTGCPATRAQLALLAPQRVGGVELIGSDVVVGESCGFGERESEAFDDALRKVPGAQALAMVEMADYGACAVVTARPARFAPGAPPPERMKSTDVAHDGTRPPSDKALVYVYRSDVGSSFRDAILHIGREKPVEIDDKEIQSLTLGPGKYAGEVRRGDLKVPFDDLELEAGRVYYLRITGTSSSQQGIILTHIAWSLALEIRDPAYAKADLRSLHRTIH